VTSLATAPPDLRPTYVLEDLRGLAAGYTAAEPQDGWWTCGSARRRLVAGGWDVNSRGSAIEDARAGVAALHAALDQGTISYERARRLVSDIEAWQ